MRFYVFSIIIAYNAASFSESKRGCPALQICFSAIAGVYYARPMSLGQVASSHLTSLGSTNTLPVLCIGSRSRTNIHRTGISLCGIVNQENGGHGGWPSGDKGVTLPIASIRNRKLQTSKAPLKSQAQGTSLFTSAASNQR